MYAKSPADRLGVGVCKTKYLLEKWEILKNSIKIHRKDTCLATIAIKSGISQYVIDRRDWIASRSHSLFLVAEIVIQESPDLKMVSP